ncbi:Glycerol-3-phosphate dehydrogenase [NAD(P)+] [Metamycoplasma auris 15026]|uniref:Glycerol-3-phosphate dehydrogenase n=2 Tax=Metamycoplasma auris TaxID=51363 RepID=N9VAM3_9BACT|nr:Glycerol-3-phosphate dehydrogenase [NAD(P)+] [Metamycoplasma auris 15026]
MNKIAILGSGAMGTACASVLVENKQDVVIYGINNNELNDLKSGYNQKYFGNKFISKFKVSFDLKEALRDANFVVIAIPTKFIEDVFAQIVSLINKKAIIINLSKGFWPNSHEFVHERMEKIAASNKKVLGVVSMIGPSFAIDIVNKNITVINAVSKDIKLAKKVKNIFANDWFGISINDDVIGAEIGSTFKNILAIGSGLVAGMGYSINTQASMLTYGLKEIKKYALYRKAKLETIYDLCSLGDLILTGLSEKSRNYQYGLHFFNDKIDDSKITVEGLYALKYIYNELKNIKELKLPLIESIYEIIYNKKNPDTIIKQLLKKI